MSYRSYNLRNMDDPCELCVQAVKDEHKIGHNLCLAQYAPDTLEQFACLKNNEIQTHWGMTSCLHDPQCCQALGDMPPANCGHCTGTAESIGASCLEYCELATEPGIGRKACHSFCNGEYERHVQSCYHLGFCSDHCPADPLQMPFTPNFYGV